MTAAPIWPTAWATMLNFLDGGPMPTFPEIEGVRHVLTVEDDAMQFDPDGYPVPQTTRQGRAGRPNAAETCPDPVRRPKSRRVEKRSPAPAFDETPPIERKRMRTVANSPATCTVMGQ